MSFEKSKILQDLLDVEGFTRANCPRSKCDLCGQMGHTRSACDLSLSGHARDLTQGRFATFARSERARTAEILIMLGMRMILKSRIIVRSRMILKSQMVLKSRRILRSRMMLRLRTCDEQQDNGDGKVNMGI